MYTFFSSHPSLQLLALAALAVAMLYAMAFAGDLVTALSSEPSLTAGLNGELVRIDG